MKHFFFTLLVLSLHLVLLQTPSYAYRPSTSCRRRCPRTKDPVCGLSLSYKFPGRKRRFRNRCQLDIANRCRVPGSPYKIVKCRSTTTQTPLPPPPPSCPSCFVILCISGTTCRTDRNGCGRCVPIAASPVPLPTPKDCPLACTLEFAPVCAKSVTGELKTFSNKCFFNAANTCKDPGSPFTLVGNGACEKTTTTPSPTCSRICTREFDPICAKSTVTGELKTFGNKCTFNSANNCKDPGSPFKFVRRGDCSKPTPTLPPVGCSCSTIRCAPGFVCKQEKGECGKCVKTDVTPKPCSCATIRCGFGTVCREKKNGCGRCIKPKIVPRVPECCAFTTCVVGSRCVEGKDGRCTCV